MSKLLADAATRARNYLATLPERCVAPDPAAVARLVEFDRTLPQHATAEADVLAQLDELGSPASVAMAGPRFFGFVIGGSYPVSLAANWLAGAWDQNAAMHEVTPTAALLERYALDWTIDLLGLPNGAGGSFVTGATVANFVSLAAARNTVLGRVGWNVEADGLFGAPEVTVVVGAEIHPSVTKSLGMLGFGRDRVVRVPVNEQGRMRADQLPEISGPTIVCTQVGNINSGACDPVGEICARLAGSGAWVHVDGAFGLWAAAAPARRDMVRGMEAADSWATDAHKWLNVPYDSGIAIVRDPHALRASMAITAAYLLTDSVERNPADFTPELSRRARGIEVWAVLRQLGRDGVADLVERCCRLAERFAAGLSEAGFEVLNEVVMNQVVVVFGDAARTERAIAAIQADGTCWCGVTKWRDRTAMRISVSNWSTTEADVDLSLAAIIRCANSA